jgi:hypothetical protein
LATPCDTLSAAALAITGTSVGALKSSYHIAVKKIEAWVTADQTKGGHEPS